MSIFKRLFGKEKQDTAESKEVLEKGLEKSRKGLFEKLARAVAGKKHIDDEVLDSLEEALIMSDVGVDTTLDIIERLQQRVARDRYVGTDELHNMLVEEVTTMLEGDEAADIAAADKPYVIMVVGVNGVGKTTTIGKLAQKMKNAGLKVMLGAADTFRAAAIEQLQEWGRRADVPVIHQQSGSDPSSVAYDTLRSALANDVDVVIIDTAGRLHNKKGLMDELTKIRRVMAKVVPAAPQEVLLVLDGSTGQNAYEQARQFTAATQVTGLAVTKLDGTAKGGVVIGISHQMKVPVRYIGLGEGIDDLQEFDKKSFVEGLFK